MKFLQTGKRHHMNNRKGGMLVLVLMIFAVSLILISSAMTITLSSRSRYYVDTERSQERLTLTCAAEAVIDAIETQELTDERLEYMAGNPTSKYYITGASGTKVADGASATDGKTIAPGLAKSGQSYTYMTVRPADDGTQDIYLKFSTLINVTNQDGKTENLEVRLHYEEPETVTPLCANMVTCGDETVPDEVDVQRLWVETDKSYTVFHGNVYVTRAGETLIHNKTVFTGPAAGGSGTYYYNDVIFYGPKAGVNVDSAGNGFWIKGDGDFYFLGVPVDGNSNIQYAFVDSNGNEKIPGGINMRSHNQNNGGAYFYRSRMSTPNYTFTHNDTKYLVSGSGATVSRTTQYDGVNNVIIKDGGAVNNNSVSTTVLESGTLNGADLTAYTRLHNKARDYLNDPALKTAAARTVPTTAQMTSDYGAYTHGTTLISTRTGNFTVQGGRKYEMYGEYHDGSLSIDLSQGVTSIYISGSVVFNAFHINVSNSSGNSLVIVMGYGTNFTMGSIKHWENKVTGILSCDTRNSTAWNQAYSAPLEATSGQKPACVIVGLGKNQFKAVQASVVDAYISLAGKGADASTVVFENGPHYYGRWEAAKYKYTGGDPSKMTYCPGMDEDSGDPKPLITKYSPETYRYFYE